MEVVEFYTGEIARLEGEVELLREESLSSPLGIAFITFDNIKSCKTVYDDHKSSYLSCFKSKPRHSSLSDSLKPDKWKVSFASTPRDVKWVNLKEGQVSHYLKIAMVYIGFFWIGFFFTTPEVIAKVINSYITVIIQGIKIPLIPFWIFNFLPGMILSIFATVMPSLVTWSVRYIGHRYKSTESYLVLRNTFWFLWVVVIVFPTFGLETVYSLLVKIVDSHGEEVAVEWWCFFSPEVSAFYVSYVISAALVGTGLELVRLFEAAL